MDQAKFYRKASSVDPLSGVQTTTDGASPPDQPAELSIDDSALMSTQAIFPGIGAIKQLESEGGEMSSDGKL
ncbi:hypothetical protein SAMN05216316_2222 [Nitrosovibrio sp. Nv6]|nr:hypothetical protein SAMN05216316_2222 [Nitrosovibrio sp. Nv6]